MTDAPERIWKWRSRFKGGVWDAWENGRFGGPPPPFADVEDVPYILATPEALAASPEVQALIREAEARGMERAAERLDLAEHDAEERDWRSGANAFATLARVIRAEVTTIQKGETP